MKPKSSGAPRLVTLVLLTGLSVLSMNMFVPSLPHMAEDFGVDYALVNFAIVGYLAVTAFLQIILGPLSDRYGRRPVLIWGLVIFSFASLGCALAEDIYLFLAFRIAQGAIVSGAAISRAVVRDTTGPQEAAGLIAYIGMAMAVAPMLGPMVGGVLDDLFGWRAGFWAYTGFGFVLLAICWVDLKETNKYLGSTFADQVSAYPELFRSRRFWGYAICLSFSIGGFYVFISGAPLVAKQVLNIGSGELGLYMGTITAGFFVGSFISGRIAPKFKLTTMMITGRLVACTGLTLALLLVAGGAVNVLTVFGSVVFVGLGNGLSSPSANAGILSVRPQLAGSASGLSGAMIVGAGAILSSVTGSLLTDTDAPVVMIGLLLACSFAGLLAALYVLWVDQRDPLPPVD